MINARDGLPEADSPDRRAFCGSKGGSAAICYERQNCTNWHAER
ncbi:hypothetical protein PAMC26577_13490 [Caballeronia sordidicola]|uniref:Uncharacterized protein n=1 Tax=Caballeronia sordidicola TaxID=196367 RepID=A0A242MVE3_CABSO|nr:hypothetical protein PAMC26577_13490 [Caballeronia sordidicola]